MHWRDHSSLSCLITNVSVSGSKNLTVALTPLVTVTGICARGGWSGASPWAQAENKTIQGNTVGCTSSSRITDWWVGLPSSLFGRCDLLSMCHYDVYTWATDSTWQHRDPGVFPHQTSILASPFYGMAVVVSAERLPFLSKAQKTLFCSCLCCVAACFSWLSLTPVLHLPSLV